MTFQAVFLLLQEVFPQIDPRILKAAAIEHAEDVDAAVEFILSDVLPNEVVDLSAEVGPGKAVPVGLEEVDEVNMTLFTDGDLVRCKRASAHHTSADVNSSGMVEAVDEGSQVGYEDDSKEPGFFMPHYESFDANLYPSAHPLPNLVDNITGVTSDLKNGALHLDNLLYKTMGDGGLSDVHDENNSDRLTSNPKLEQDSLGKHLQFCVEVAEDVDDDKLNAERSIALVDTDDKNPSSANVEKNLDLMEYETSVEVDTNHYVSESEVPQSQCSVEPARSQDLCGLEANDTASSTFISGQDILLTVCDKSSDSVDYGAEVQKGTGNTSSEYEEQQSRCLSKNGALLAVESQLPSADDNHLPSTLATRSGHLVSIEFLEECITDAKSNKKNLLSAKELVTNLMKEVEFLEKRAKQTKEEALTSGQDILLKVEELKQMLKHAKEANDMHAGEVYGEKAILATEARELQCRLLGLSDERNKSLSVIEEIRQTLEARRCAVEEEMAAAEQEKLEREELARKALGEQELIMDTIVGESKKLQQQAEENSRLREFLMDRGLIVDALQGEMAVMWEDVMSLKARVDGRIPPSKSQRSSISCSASSSGSSCHESIHSSDRVLHHVELADQDSSKRQLPENSNNNDKENYVGRNLSVPYHDDWAFFEI
ncbi:uncharacterized protein [Elaeis guineensis]|uniref:Uncharacterized protein LOC105057766 isoform X1 n=3 Tax=Elaeis guineensis var. tenera TaxID=51953 RepID=A0A6I9S7F6_ELAGV|nr:uncharacterized protein LOC105057766 isoform X1 [Elaeis guineensis]XP_010938759.1 uncharacterized protein LOC105057766 isoform X1 [Elaeis guineensis]